MNQREFDEFNLVGGTSLALQMGHRISIDIDLFGASEIDEDLFLEVLKKFGTVQVIKKSKNILIFFTCLGTEINTLDNKLLVFFLVFYFCCYIIFNQ